MKGTVHIFMTLVFLFSGMSYSLIQTHFYLNRDEIAAKFCVNKDNPTLACNGQCELSKRLANTKENNQEQEGMMVGDFQMHYNKTEAIHVLSFPLAALEKEHQPFSNIFNFFDIDYDFFQPPQWI
jgi:hypothetical protein